MELHKSLYMEHLEEISALYDQRLSLTNDNKANFQGAANTERRMEAHLDALIIAGEHSYDICAEPDDYGELYASISFFCKINETGQVKKLLSDLDYDDLKQVQAAKDALMLYMPEQFEKEPLIKTFIKSSETKKQDIPELIRIGLEGKPYTISELIEKLSEADLSEQAALALNLITGADLFEDVFIPYEIDEDMLFEDELEKLKKGEPLYPPGKEPGINITRLCQTRQPWLQYLEENEKNFDPDLRYRNGKPYSPQCLVENLKSKIYPNFIRRFVSEELKSNYNIDVSFNTSMLVKEQLNAINKIEFIADQIKDKFEPGVIK